jgi:hypothetical protein
LRFAGQIFNRQTGRGKQPAASKANLLIATPRQ